MNQNKGIIGIGLILAIVLGIVAAGGAYYLEKKSTNKIEKSQFQETKNLNADLYPLYPNLSWGSEVSASQDTHGLNLSGFKIVSKNILDGEYYKLNTTFEKYYDTKLTSLGWVRDNQFQADGAGSSSWLYTKGGERIIFSYDTTAINQKPNEPLSCPCNMVFEIFSGKENIDKTKAMNAKDDLAIFESKTFGYLIGYSGIDNKNVYITGDGKNINLFPNQSNIDALEIVDSSYVMPNYTSSVGMVTFGTNQYKKFKDNITPRHTYYFKSGLINNKSIFISIENDSDNPNYLDLSSLKINPIDSEIISTTEESSTENFKNQPGAVKSIKVDGANKWILAVDLLSNNPKWIPGENEFFINQNTKIRNLIISNTTKIQDCTTQNKDYVSGFKNDLLSFVIYIQDKINKSKTEPGLVGYFGYTAYFDVNGTNITAIYEQCLP